MRNKLVLAAALAFCASLPASAQQDFSKVEVKPEKLVDGVYMLTGAGGNIGVSAGADGRSPAPRSRRSATCSRPRATRWRRS